MAHPIQMPARGERAAPTFDTTKPRELPRFFDDLEYLFDRAGMTENADRKKHLLRYVDVDTEQTWKTFSEYKSIDKTYSDLKEAILKYYPDACGDFLYSLRDMDLLIGERQRVGITSTNDLTAYHLQFIAITSWLIDKKQLGDLEQQRAYIRAFQPQLLSAINNRLQLKNPDHHPNVPYEVQDVYDAARFILQGSSVTSQSYQSSPASTQFGQSQAAASAEPTIKKEDLASLLSEFTKTIVGAMSQNQNRSTGGGGSRGLSCLMCSGPHLISTCPVVQEYIQAGKCRRNHEGKVILSTGAWIPRDIPGNNIKERVDAWHERNPGQLAAATLLNTISTQVPGIYPHPNLVQTAKLPAHSPTPSAFNPSSYQLSSDDRIAALEAEIFNLKARKVVANVPIRTRAQRARIETIDEEDDTPADVLDTRKKEIIDKARAAQKARETASAAPIPESSTTTQFIPTQQPTSIPEHPFRNAKDASYIPTIADKAASNPVRPQTFNKKPDAAYKTLPPIHDASIALEVYKRTMEAPITITQRELLSLSPEVRSQVRDATTTKRVPNKENVTIQSMVQTHEVIDLTADEIIDLTGEDEVIDLTMDDEVIDLTRDSRSPSVPSFAVPSAHYRTPPAGSLVVPDPYETYIRTLGPGQKPDADKLTVANDSVAIRSILALIDNSMKVECILDPGCQIIAMSERICHEIGLAYDPAIRLNMQSANGEVNQSLGLARNVPFRVGNITFYLQVHIIQTPAYDILLGRPFDILTESVVRNFSNEDQTITICDPNTGQRITVPTLPRNIRCHHHQKRDF